jgi:hypothetical protein
MGGSTIILPTARGRKREGLGPGKSFSTCASSAQPHGPRKGGWYAHHTAHRHRRGHSDPACGRREFWTSWAQPGAAGAHPHGHTESVNSVAFSPDGRLLASGSWLTRTIKLWEVASGSLVRTLSGHTGWCHFRGVQPRRAAPGLRLRLRGQDDQAVGSGQWQKCAPSQATPTMSFRGVQPRRAAPGLRLR